MVIPIIGPSKAGKTQTTERLIANGVLTLDRIDLDEVLGPSDRGDGGKAVRIVQAGSVADSPRHVLVDVGAGQLVSRTFQTYLRNFPGYPRSVVVIWCDEATFRERHGENAHNEVGRYYGGSPLVEFWNAARTSGRFVETSGPYAPAVWASELSKVVRQMLPN